MSTTEPVDPDQKPSLLDCPPTSAEYLHVAKLTGLISGLVLAIYLAYRTVSSAPDVFMIGFLGILFAIFLASLSRLVGRYTGLTYGRSLGAVTLLLLLALGGFVVLFGTTIYGHLQQGVEQFQAGGTELIEMVDRSPPLRAVVDSVPFLDSLRKQPRGGQDDRSQQAAGNGSASGSSQQTPAAAASGDGAGSDSGGGDGSGGDSGGGADGGEDALGGGAEIAMNVTRGVGAFATRFFVSTFGFLTNLVLITIVGLYLAASPHAYQRSPSYLFPPRVRPEVVRILTLIGETLWRWLLGRLFSMSVSGGGTAVLLYFFDIPSALLIGGLTFLLGFIPNLGPLLAMGVAVLFALPEGLSSVALVIGVLSFFELLESYLVTPLVTEHQVSLPPALVIFFQALMGISLGFIGLTIAAPLLAVVRVLFNEIYRKRLLKESGVEPSPGEDAA